MRELAKVRKQGYAISYGERISGVVGISAPIKNYLCPAALSILGLEQRLSNELTNLVKEVKSCADSISVEIKANT